MSIAREQITPQLADVLVDLADFLLDFSRVERVTYHQDGIRRETDADHTVMLTVMAWILVQRFRPDLDLGKVLVFTSIHDLVEAIVGDTSSLGISETDRAAKELREQEALKHIEHRFGHLLPELHLSIEEYERQDTPEARFVKMLDKLMPTMSHLLNNGRVFAVENVSKAKLLKDSEVSTKRYLSSFGVGNEELLALRELLRVRVLNECFGHDQS